MKRFFKLGLAALVLAAGLVTLVSFATKEKKLSIVSYYYNGPNKRVAPGFSNSITMTDFKNTANWAVTTSVSDADNGQFLSAIQFENSGAGSYSLSTALDAAYTYYVAQDPDNFTHNLNISTTGSTLKILLQSTTDNH
jgi:hypothetical protein